MATELERQRPPSRQYRKSGAPDVRFFDADMRKSSAIDAMMTAVAAWGGADILVNNAGNPRHDKSCRSDPASVGRHHCCKFVGGVRHHAARAASNGSAPITVV